MSKLKILVTFNPVSKSEDQFSFSPEKAILQGETTVVDLVLQTKSQNGSEARFAKTEGVRWTTAGPQNLKQATNPQRTVLELRGFPRDRDQKTVDYGYEVTVEYEGRTFSSSSSYPVMSCIQT